ARHLRARWRAHRQAPVESGFAVLVLGLVGGLVGRFVGGLVGRFVGGLVGSLGLGVLGLGRLGLLGLGVLGSLGSLGGLGLLGRLGLGLCGLLRRPLGGLLRLRGDRLLGHQLDHGHRSVVALTRHGLGDPDVAAGTVGEVRADLRDQLVHHVLVPDHLHDLPAVVQITALGLGDQLLG